MIFFLFLLKTLIEGKEYPSGGFRGGSRGSLEPPSGPTLFRFNGEFQKILCEIRQTNPPFLHLNPLFRNPGSAPVPTIYALDQKPLNPSFTK